MKKYFIILSILVTQVSGAFCQGVLKSTSIDNQFKIGFNASYIIHHTLLQAQIGKYSLYGNDEVGDGYLIGVTARKPLKRANLNLQLSYSRSSYFFGFHNPAQVLDPVNLSRDWMVSTIILPVRIFNFSPTLESKKIIGIAFGLGPIFSYIVKSDPAFDIMSPNDPFYNPYNEVIDSVVSELHQFTLSVQGTVSYTYRRFRAEVGLRNNLRSAIAPVPFEGNEHLVNLRQMMMTVGFAYQFFNL